MWLLCAMHLHALVTSTRAARDWSVCSTRFAALVTRKPRVTVGIVRQGLFTFIWHLCTMVDRSVPCQSCVLCHALSFFFFLGSAPGLEKGAPRRDSSDMYIT
uniref:Secreted protein n=1 Tax=Rhipicephalus appendiculatus TaxID=34631 RepID=A0A131YCU9_RHIAP